MQTDPDDAVAYFDFRDHLASDVRTGLCRQDPRSLVMHAAECGDLDPAVAGEWVERFLDDVKRHLRLRQQPG